MFLGARPSGAVIACDGFHPGKQETFVAFYERNGLRHYEFVLNGEEGEVVVEGEGGGAMFCEV